MLEEGRAPAPSPGPGCGSASQQDAALQGEGGWLDGSRGTAVAGTEGREFRGVEGGKTVSEGSWAVKEAVRPWAGGQWPRKALQSGNPSQPGVHRDWLCSESEVGMLRQGQDDHVT